MKKLSKYVVILITWTTIPFCLGSISKDPVTVAISSTPNNLNPLFSTDSNSQNIGRLLHIALIDFDPKMKPVCMACENFKERFEGGKYFIDFKLRNDLSFWDNTPVNAQSIKDAWEIYTSNDEKSIFRFAFRKIKRILIKNDYELSLEYDEFALDALPNLTLMKIIKKSKEEILGAGPYKLKKQTEFMVELEPRGLDLEVLKFKVVKDETTLALKMIKGEIDIAVTEISPRKLKWLRENAKNINLNSKESSIYRYININHQNSILKNLKVRKALAHLVPRKDIIKYRLNNSAVISTGFLGEAFGDYHIDLSPIEYNKRKAIILLEEAGFPLKDGKRFKLNWISTNNRSILEVITFIKASFEEVGIEVDLVTQEWGTFMKNVKTGAFDIYTSQWIGFTGPDILNFVFLSENFPPKGANRGLYSNPELDELLKEAASSKKLSERKEKYGKAQKLIYQDVAYINLWHPKIVWPAKDCIKFPILYPTGSYLAFLKLENNCKNQE